VRAEQNAEIADRRHVYLRSNNSEPRHKHDASTMTDTRRAWSGAETRLSAGPDASVLDLRADIFNPALQRDRCGRMSPLFCAVGAGPEPTLSRSAPGEPPAMSASSDFAAFGSLETAARALRVFSDWSSQ
jgi:hypothetical protein